MPSARSRSSAVDDPASRQVRWPSITIHIALMVALHRRLPNTGAVTPRGGPRSRLRAEVLVDLADRHRSLADRGGHPFDRAATHVSHREHTGLAGLQHHRLTLRGHVIATGVRVERCRTGRDEAAVVQLNGAGEP